MVFNTITASCLRGDGDSDQLISASTTREGIYCDGSGGGGDGHGRNAAAGGAHAHYRKSVKHTR